MNFRLIYIALFLVGFCGNVTAEDVGIKFFHGTWAEALEKAAAEDKLIFVDAYAQWCGPCKMMAKKVFTEASVGEFFNENFINMKMDMEAAESKDFKRSFAVSAYPTLFWINGENKQIHKSVGGKRVDDLIATAALALSKNDTSGKYEEAYLAGNRDYDLVYGYVKALNHVKKPTLKISNEYLASKPEISETQKSQFVFEACLEADSKMCKYLIESKDGLIKANGQEAWDEKLSIICWKTVEKAIEYEYVELIDEATTVMKEHHSDPAGFEYESRLMYYSVMKDAASYKPIASKYFKKVAKKNETALKTLIDQIKAKFVDQEDIMKSCEKYAKQLVKLDKTEDNYIILADVYSKSDQKVKAIETCEEATEWLKKKEIKTEKIEAYTRFLKKA